MTGEKKVRNLENIRFVSHSLNGVLWMIQSHERIIKYRLRGVQKTCRHGIMLREEDGYKGALH